MMRTERVDRYRGIETPRLTEPSTAAPSSLVTPLGPRQAAPKTQASTASTYRAATVLRSSLERWTPREADGPAHPSRCRPPVNYAGISEIRGFLPVSVQNSRPILFGQTDVTLAPSGLLLVGMSEPTITSFCVSAKMDASGALTEVSRQRSGVMIDGPLVKDGIAIVTSEHGLGTMRIAADGSLGDPREIHATHGRPLLLRDGRVVASRQGELVIYTMATDGTLQPTCSASLSENVSYFRTSLTALGNTILLASDGALGLYRIDRDALTFLNTIELEKEAGGSSPPTFVHHDVAVVSIGGVLHSVIVGKDALTLGTSFKPPAAEWGSSVVVKDGYAVFGSGNTLYSVEVGTKGELTERGQFSGAGEFRVRPTITDDGVVVAVSDDSVVESAVHALELRSDGQLAKIEEKRFSGQIHAPVTVLPGGFVAVSSTNGVYTLRGR